MIDKKSIRTTIARDTKRVTRYEYPETAIREALNLPPQDTAANRVRIYMRVPGGGDWSNTDLEIDDRKNGERLIVEVTEITREETEE